jgi:outer membrane protein assembly factor BamB
MTNRWKLTALLAAGLIGSSVRADDWPQWHGPQRDGVWREDGIVAEMPKKPSYKWRTLIGAGYAGPAVAGDRVFVHDRVLDEGAKNPDNPFARASIPGKERIHALEEASGKILWTHEYPCNYTISYGSGPRCTPVVSDGKLFTLGAMGHLKCLNAVDGKVIWEKDLAKEYKAPAQLWGYSAHPLLDGERLICLVGGTASVVAFHKDTGQEIWQSMAVAQPGYCPPVIYKINGVNQLIIWHPEAVNGLDPVTGKVLWSVPFQLHRSSLAIPMPRLDGDRIFVTSFYNGPLMLRVAGDPPSAKQLWKGGSNSEQPKKTVGLHSIMPTPVIDNGYIFGVCSYGQLRCLKADTGDRVWETMRATRPVKDGKIDERTDNINEDDRWGNAFLTPQSGRYWLFNEHGDLILAKLSGQGYQELGRMNIIAPDNQMARHPVVWSHPAYAHRCCYVRNDSEIVCVDLAEKK